MAFRARLAAPSPPPREIWPYHSVVHASVRASLLLAGDRRMEAETYLSSGFGIRTAIQSRADGWCPLGTVARVWMPGRLKGIQVERNFGVPFLAATQVFDVRPIPRKWFSLARTDKATERFVLPGMILVTRSGSVGRPTLAYDAHRETLISDDLLRVEAVRPRDNGWVYAFLLASQTREMATGAHYGHMIKHLETSHLEALPMPAVDDAVSLDLNRRVSHIIDLRNTCHRLTVEAEAKFEKELGTFEVKDWGEHGFETRASKTFLTGRRRLDAFIHNPGAAAIRRHLSKAGSDVMPLSSMGYDVWIPGRFRRVPATDGVWLLDSADLLETNPDRTKRIADGDFGDPYNGRVKAGWIVMPRSGQTYGIIGTAMLAGRDIENDVISDHVMRMMPRKDATVKPGYLVTAMTHPALGRPLVKALAYGSSIPEIDPADLAGLNVVRLNPRAEGDIADLAEASAKARADADLEERHVTRIAEEIIDRFMASGGSRDNKDVDSDDAEIARRRLKEIKTDPSLLKTGDELKVELDELLS